MKKCDYNFIFIFIALVLVCGLVSVYISKKDNSEPIKEYSPKYELVSIETDLVVTVSNTFGAVQRQDIRYTLIYIEDDKFVVYQTFELNLTVCDEPYIQAVDNWYGGYIGCATKEMMASIANKENR